MAVDLCPGWSFASGCTYQLQHRRRIFRGWVSLKVKVNEDHVGNGWSNPKTIENGGTSSLHCLFLKSNLHLLTFPFNPKNSVFKGELWHRHARLPGDVCRDQLCRTANPFSVVPRNVIFVAYFSWVDMMRVKKVHKYNESSSSSFQKIGKFKWFIIIPI